jgi:predicted secreted protein
VARGERFTFAVHESASTRTRWELALPEPDPGLVGTAYVETFQTEKERASDGAGHTKYFVFQARRPGSTDVVLAETGTGQVVTYRVVIGG